MYSSWKLKKKTGYRKVFAVQEIKKVEPPDYQDNKKRIKFLEKKCKSLEDILRFGHISSVATLIEEYQSLSKTYLDKISVELESLLC